MSTGSTSWQVGDVAIQRIVELETVGGTRFLLPDATPDAVRMIEWLRPWCADDQGQLIMCIHSYLLKTPTQTILIDTALGNGKQRPIPLWHDRDGPYLLELAALGVTRESVDLVICTHLHVDHVGWNTMLVDGHWVPTFPNARYLFGRTEWEHWDTQAEQDFGPVIDDSVRPIVDAGLADLFDPNDQLTKELRAEPTPGHSIGHSSIWIESAGEQALITGDFLHHPVQAARIDWYSTADFDRRQAVSTRRRMFNRLAGQKTRLFGAHFAAPCIVVRDQLAGGADQYRLQPESN